MTMAPRLLDDLARVFAHAAVDAFMCQSEAGAASTTYNREHDDRRQKGPHESGPNSDSKFRYAEV